MVESASYRALFAVRGFGRVVAATVLARLGNQMWEVVIVLFVLARYRSPALAGVTVLMALLPGLVLSPVAGALLDRQGRVRLMVLDYTVTAALTTTIVVLSLRHLLPPVLLIGIVTLLSISNILSTTGARSLFPLMLPRDLWDRANGLDSSSYSLTAVVGPALAGLVIAKFGAEAGLLLTAFVAGSAAVSLIGVAEPVSRTTPSRSLIHDALAALAYVLRHPTLRGLAISLLLLNLGAGVLVVGIPVLVLRELHGTAATVGQALAIYGIAGLIAGLIVGRFNTEGRERRLITAGALVQAVVLALLAITGSVATLFAVAALLGVGSAAANIGIFALRQRRTEMAWFGRAFAVSMSLNLAGQPIGSALSGPLLAQSIAFPMLLGAAITMIAAVSTFILIPVRDEDAARRGRLS